jgi:DNA-binding NtrC family response regulator
LPDRLRVIVIDDEPIVSKRLKPALEKSGFVVECFDSGAAALKRIQEAGFDIVVTDFRMDEVDGMEVLSSVMATSPRTKVIIITGYATIEVAREAMAKGAFDVIAKPFRPNDLREIIQKAAEVLNTEKA